MASFTRPFDPTAVSQQPDVTVQLPDPPRLPGDPFGNPIVRPGVARYASATIVLMHVTPSSASVTLESPAVGTARNVALDTPLTGGISQLLEISPLPFKIASALKELQFGLPTFYLGYNRALNTPADDTLVDPAIALTSITGDLYFGLLFQDRVALSPPAWIEMIRSALAGAGETAEAVTWNSLASLYGSARSLRILDHAGKLSAGESFQVRIRKTDNNFEGPWTLTTGTDGDLEKAAASTPLARSVGPQASLFGASGERTELKWAGNAPSGDTTLPVHALYETGLSAAPGEAILLPSGTSQGHLQLLELSRWYARRPADTPSPSLARYRINSRVQPLVDGVGTYKLLVGDLLASASKDNGAHFAGWAFKDFHMDKGRKDSSGAEIDTRLSALSQHIIDGEGDVRFLVYKFINFKANPDTEAKGKTILILYLFTEATLLFSLLSAFNTDLVGYFVLMGGLILAPVLIDQLLSVSDLLKDKAEQSTDIFPVLNGIKNNVALWSSHPVRLEDNPLGTSLPLSLDDFLDRFGAWHQKIQLIKRPADADGNQYIAYLGGIDISPNRLDDPGHQIQSPFHDIHARVTGPGAVDVFRTWDERYAHDRTGVAGSLGPAFTVPDPATMNVQPAKHITQIGRTYFRAKTSGSTTPFTFAPSGERTTNDTLTKAIKEAREYIYIEDQYFTPNDSQPPGSADTYFDVLLAAAGHCRRLVIVVPAETDQPFGDLRRRWLFQRLETAWADRVLIGTALRRPMLSNPGRLTSEGRCALMDNMTSTTATIVIGPKARVPNSTNFWLWINGELMLSTGLPRPTTVNGTPAMEVDVLRGALGSNPRWGASERSHKKGAAVTLSQHKGIYIHSKTMMVDDIFVGIGSTNINRRGLFHDGEIHVFAIPEQLKSAEDNPARSLRTSLWAEQLGLPPTMGEALLADPIAAFELFRRSNYQGNRFVPFSALDLNAYLSIPTTDTLALQLLKGALFTWASTLIPTIWNSLSDPTSFLESDLDPTPGPTTP